MLFLNVNGFASNYKIVADMPFSEIMVNLFKA